MTKHHGGSFHFQRSGPGVWAGWENALAHDPEFLNHAFDPAESDKYAMSAGEWVKLLIGEAEQALAMIGPHLYPGAHVLEVGGGVGLVYAELRSRGWDIVSLEPGWEGFGDRHDAGMRLLKIMGIDPKGWLRMGIEEFSPSGRPFDLVFSYFVLEHLPDLDRAFAVMAEALSPDGVMVHRCPNYTVPFEPHYNIPLVPFKPEWTALVCPSCAGKRLWCGLQFTTVGGIMRLCSSCGLRPVFRKGMTAWAFERVLNDSVFSARKKGFVRAGRLLQATGMLNMLRRLPANLQTPMQFTATKLRPTYPRPQ